MDRFPKLAKFPGLPLYLHSINSFMAKPLSYRNQDLRHERELRGFLINYLRGYEFDQENRWSVEESMYMVISDYNKHEYMFILVMGQL